MSGLRVYLAGILLLVSSTFLTVSGIIHLTNGIAVDSAFPVPLALSTDRVIPRAAYRDAAYSLERSNSHDGTAQIALAEARFRAGEDSGKTMGAVMNGLTAAPSTAEGWAFYAEMLRPTNPVKAAKAFAQSVTLAPYDYFWTAHRALIASRLWEYLDDDSRTAALQDVHVIWNEPGLRDNLLVLVDEPGGAHLVTRAYATDPTALRALNRWISGRRRELQPGPTP